MLISKKLCPQCETGKKMLELDKKEPVCPYMMYHDGKHCLKYVKIKNQKRSLIKKLIKI